MSHARPVVKPADDPAFKLPASLSALTLPMLGGGLLLLVAGWAVGNFMGNPRVGMSAYLTGFVYCLTLATGSLFFVLIQHLVRAGWSTVVRRIAELVMMMVIPLAILFLPILLTLFFSEGMLYRWDDPQFATDNHLPALAWAEKSRWLSQGWFAVRAIIYFAVWIVLALYFFRGSTQQDETGERAVTDRLQYWSGPATMAFCGVTSFAAFDWVMSLAPMWFSTMFGVYLFAGSVLATHCMLAVAAFVLQKKGAMRDEVTVEHYHDLAKLIFGFLLFWMYIAFSQYMLIWYGNIPEETEWIYHRQLGGWGTMTVALIFLHWMLPFLGLMSMYVRRRPGIVVFWAAYVLVMHFFDLFWIIMPEAAVASELPYSVQFVGVASAVMCALGMSALLTGLVLKVASGTKVVAVRDPRLAESMAFENV
ncbi:hypothetical protein K227x_51450 [Rubripirellula lacrimiformis]|uniref:Quinol:cytochrome C oxidoreductase n=1 Tax=Rubripirellula lacrimiformis TaxID=1930273 RepID=A0A517NHW7_9BACT|nr:hypothetical protein [Rubripirellula lacrimiformis]QDT06729.1 hypothetical protein K227x_51450 [Rubripirellula lacrimiformis]